MLKTLDVQSESAQHFNFDADLYEGETLLFRWANAEMTHEFDPLADQMEAWFATDRRFLAAWQQAVFPSGNPDRPETARLRGRNGWNIVSQHWHDPDLDCSEATLESEKTQKLLARFRSFDGTATTLVPIPDSIGTTIKAIATSITSGDRPWRFTGS